MLLLISVYELGTNHVQHNGEGQFLNFIAHIFMINSSYSWYVGNSLPLLLHGPHRFNCDNIRLTIFWPPTEKEKFINRLTLCLYHSIDNT